MERHEIIEAMTELKLYGMRASFDEIAGKPVPRHRASATQGSNEEPRDARRYYDGAPAVKMGDPRQSMKAQNGALLPVLAA